MPQVRRRRKVYYCRPVRRRKGYLGRRRRTVRSYSRRQRFRRSRLTVRPFPKTKVVKLKYVKHFQLTPTSDIPVGGPVSAPTPGCCRTFKANDIYDPDPLAGGHQPYGRDQLAAVYGKYTVIWSKITARFVNNRSTTNDVQSQPVYVGLIRHNQSTDATRLNTVAGLELGMEAPPNREFTHKIQLLKSQTQVEGTAKSVSMNYSPKYSWMIPKKDSILDIGGIAKIDMDTSPTLPTYFTVLAKTVPESSNANNIVTVQMTVEYTVLCTDPVYLNQS